MSEYSQMARTARTITIMALAPPFLFYGLAHLGAFFGPHSDLIGYSAWIVAWVTAMAALATSGWRRSGVVGVAYTLVAIPLFPFLTLLAVCSTGHCL